MAASSRACSGGVDGRANLLIGPAATDVGELPVDVGIGGLRLLLEQRRHRHDHAGLAVAALRHVMLDPRLLHRVQRAVLGEPFDGRDLLAVGLADRQRARAHCLPVDVNRAGSALRDAAAVLGSGHAELLADHPQERGVRLDVDLMLLSVDGKTGHYCPPCGHDAGTGGGLWTADWTFSNSTIRARQSQIGTGIIPESVAGRKGWAIVMRSQRAAGSSAPSEARLRTARPSSTGRAETPVRED